ncbi:MAG TPA: peptide-methionine (S)-S-oxide reductase MsrA [Thermoanaerobaculia bacterium]|jgi:peptide-methionine (S)-S-oxide reductase|nr:peptide-methionine (S)-S-oxide reductase MsrA [Thermoanaerobaculia bacterium]
MIRNHALPRFAFAIPALVAVLLLGAACSPAGGQGQGTATGTKAVAGAPATPANPHRAVATFAMGCFWCAEDAFEGHAGVISVVSGYTGGSEKNPTYEQVSAHRTGHFESIEVTYDPAKVSYEQLLDVFWHNVDPTDGGGQFCDQGPQYRSAIFVHDDAQRRAAEASKAAVAGKLRNVATLILPAGPFYAAEGYHQDFAKNNPLRYRFYSTGCGRAARLRQVWGDAAGGQH